MQIYRPGDCPGALTAVNGTVTFGIEMDPSFLVSDWFALELSAHLRAEYDAADNAGTVRMRIF